MIIIERILHFTKYKQFSLRQFEKKIGSSSGLLSNANRKKTDIQSKWVSKIIEMFPELNSEWLLTGSGEMLKTGPGVENSINGDYSVNNINGKVGDVTIGTSLTAKGKEYKAANELLKKENGFLSREIKSLNEKLIMKDEIIELLKRK